MGRSAHNSGEKSNCSMAPTFVRWEREGQYKQWSCWGKTMGEFYDIGSMDREGKEEGCQSWYTLLMFSKNGTVSLKSLEYHICSFFTTQIC